MRSADAARAQRGKALAPGPRGFDSDERLIAAVRGGSEHAFGVLYERHFAAVRGLCRLMLRSSEEAEDAVQHAFTAAYVDIMGSPKPIVLRPWLLTIARHRCLTVIGSRRLWRDAPLDESASPALTLEVDVREELRAVMDDIARLPEDQRVALVLREIGGASYAEIARILEAPAARGRALVFQARSSLRASRRAREIPCADIRRTLSISRGGALRRSDLRHHLRQCEGCRVVAAEQRARRRGLKSLLPLGPVVALGRTPLGAFVTSRVGSGTALLEGGVTAKALVTIAIGGGGGLAGVAASGGSPSSPEVPLPAFAAGAGSVGTAGSDHRAARASGTGDRVRIGTVMRIRNGRANARRGDDRARPAEEAVKPPSGADASGPTGGAPTAVGGSEPPETPSVPSGGERPDVASVDHDRPPAPQPGADRPPPGQNVAVANGGVGGAPGQSGASGQGQGAVGPPAKPGPPPGQGGGPPAKPGPPPGQGGGPPGPRPPRGPG